MLYKGANPNTQNEDLETPLHRASKYGGIAEVKALLDNGAAIDACDKWKETPLHDAARAGNIDVLAHLLQQGANPNIHGEHFQTPLHMASRNGSLNIAKALLENGATIDAYDEWKGTPLHDAATAGSIDVLAFLLHKGANPNSQDNSGWTPLYLAANKGDLNAITTLLEHGTNVNINTQTNKGVTPLVIAISNDHCEAARLLIDRGADINLLGKDGETALRIALMKSDNEFVCDLIRLGADLGSMDPFGMTCSNWLQRLRPHLMTPEVEGQEPDKINSGPDLSVLRGTLVNIAKGMNNGEKRLGAYELARCFLLLEMEDDAMRAYNFMPNNNVACDNCDIELVGNVAFFACKFCPNTDFCEPCMEGHSEAFRRKNCLSHAFLKIMPLEASTRADDDDEAFKKWLDDIIEQFTD